MRRFFIGRNNLVAKRGNKEGSVYQRKSDGKWVTSITLDNGQRKVLYSNSQADAIKKLKKAAQEQEKGTLTVGPQHTLVGQLTIGLQKEKERG
jgi:3-dehydroquinate synthase class II